jgi:antitoxin MazE
MDLEQKVHEKEEKPRRHGIVDVLDESRSACLQCKRQLREIAMKSHTVRIGNCRRIRIPKDLLEQTDLCGSVEITVERGTLVIGPAKKPRDGWSEAFRQMAERGDDILLDTPLPSGC